MAPHKRPAASVGAGNAAKKRAVATKCTGIADTVKSSSLPDHVRNMLAEALGSCLQTYKQDRHEYQNKLLEMVAEVLASVKASRQGEFQAAEAKVAGAAQDKDARQSALDRAHGVLQAAQTDQHDKQAAHAADIEAVKVATAAKKAAHAHKADGHKAMGEMKAKIAKLEKAFSANVFGSFKEQAGKSADVKDFVKVCLDSGLEKSLLDTVPSVLHTAPAARGTFGHLIVEQLEAQLTQQVGAFTSSFNAMTRGEIEDAAAVAHAEEDLQAAVDKRDNGAAALETARATVKDAKVSLAVAQKAVDEFVPELQRSQSAMATASAALKALEEGPLANFKELLAYAPASEPTASEVAPMESTPSKMFSSLFSPRRSLSAPAAEPSPMEVSGADDAGTAA